MTTKEKAAYYLESGFKIVPLYGVTEDLKCSCGGNHEKKLIGKHPTIERWAEASETATFSDLEGWFPDGSIRNIGIYCQGSGFLAVDEDPRNRGAESAYAMECATEGSIPDTITVITGEFESPFNVERGNHRYFLHPTGTPVHGKLKNWPGLDFKHNGYVVAPGSRHASGVDYEWATGKAPWEIEIATAPAELLACIETKGKNKSARKESRNSLGGLEWIEQYDSLLDAEVTATPYAKKTLQNLEKDVSTAIKGTRNNTINAACYVAGQLIAGGQISYSEARKAIWDAAVRNYGRDFDNSKRRRLESVMREFGGGFEMGALEPRYPNELSPEQRAWVQRITQSGSGLDEEELFTKIQMGFLDNRGGLLLDTVIQTLEEISPLATGTDHRIWFYRNGCWHPGGEKEVVRNLKVLLGERARSAHISNVLDYLSARHPKIMGVGNPDYINVKNGMLNWRTLDLYPHGPEYFSTYQIDVNWNPDATCPTVDGWLRTVVDPSLISLLWEICGVAIYPGMGFHKAVFLFGTGRNGKGTLLRLIEKLVPPVARTNVEPHRLAADRFATAQLFGKILNICGDISSEALKDTSRFKMVTGEDEIPAEFKHKDAFSFTSTATQIFAANKMPIAYDRSPGFMSRILIVPFDQIQLDENEVDKTLEPRMWLELEGVLVRAISGLSRAMERGSFDEPRLCILAKMHYADELSSVDLFIESMLVHEPGAVVISKEMFEVYRQFCEARSLRAETVIGFNRKFKALTEGTVHPRQISGGIDVYEGVSILDAGDRP